MSKTSRARSEGGPGGFVRRHGLVSFYAMAFGLTPQAAASQGWPPGLRPSTAA